MSETIDLMALVEAIANLTEEVRELRVEIRSIISVRPVCRYQERGGGAGGPAVFGGSHGR